MRKTNRIIIIIIFCASIVLLFSGWVIKGTYIGSDTKLYLLTGEQIIDWIATAEPDIHQLNELKYFPYYTISSVILSAVHRSLNMGEAGVMAVNWTLFSVAACLVFWTWLNIYAFRGEAWGRPGLIAGVIGGLYIIFGLPDGFLWSYAVLTDTIFLFWVSVFVVSTTMGLLGGSRYWWVVSLIAAVSAPFVRPPGLLLPFLCLYALGLHRLCVKRGKVGTVVLISLVIPGGVAFVVIPWLVLMKINGDPLADALIPDFLNTYFSWAADSFVKGIVVRTRVELDLDSLPGYIEIVRMIIHRLGYYWIPIRLGERPYSLIHNIVNTVYIMAALPLLFLGIRDLIRKGRRCALAGLFLIMVAYSYALFHATTLVSFDWRYQLPGMVPFWILAGCGWYAILCGPADAGRSGTMKTAAQGSHRQQGAHNRARDGVL